MEQSNIPAAGPAEDEPFNELEAVKYTLHTGTGKPGAGAQPVAKMS